MSKHLKTVWLIAVVPSNYELPDVLLCDVDLIPNHYKKWLLQNNGTDLADAEAGDIYDLLFTYRLDANKYTFDIEETLKFYFL